MRAAGKQFQLFKSKSQTHRPTNPDSEVLMRDNVRKFSTFRSLKKKFVRTSQAHNSIKLAIVYRNIRDYMLCMCLHRMTTKPV